MNRRTLLSSAAALAVAGAAAALWPERVPLPVTPAAAQDGEEVDTSRVLEMSLGNPDAEVTVIEYAMFTCPHCRAFHEGPFKELKANYIDKGKINYIFREVYFNGPALWAGMLARCVEQERYFGMVDLIFGSQNTWLESGDPATILESLKKLGATAGLSEQEIDACIQDRDMGRALVAVFQKNAETHGIDSTPSFIINGEKYSNMSYEEFSRVLDDKLGS